MNARSFDWIWHIKGSVALAPGQSGDDTFARLAPLFRQRGTSHERIGDALTFRKKDPAAQDSMSIFDHGVLQVERTAAGPVLYYKLTSRALLYCFLAPLLFLACAQLTVFIGNLQSPTAETKKPEAQDKVLKLHPIDQALGAPAPEKPKQDDKSKDDKKPKPTASYVFAAIFAVLYAVGRVLEDRLIKRLFQRTLLHPPVSSSDRHQPEALPS